jgi:hypothetical protein
MLLYGMRTIKEHTRPIKLLALTGVMAACLVLTPMAGNAQASTPATRGCPAAIVRIIQADFGRSASWAVGIAWRESRCQPSAANKRSSARGVFQLLVPLHARQYAAVGCSWRQWANPYCNIAAAAHLFHEQGTRPWR